MLVDFALPDRDVFAVLFGFENYNATRPRDFMLAIGSLPQESGWLQLQSQTGVNERSVIVPSAAVGCLAACHFLTPRECLTASKSGFFLIQESQIAVAASEPGTIEVFTQGHGVFSGSAQEFPYLAQCQTIMICEMFS